MVVYIIFYFQIFLLFFLECGDRVFVVLRKEVYYFMDIKAERKTDKYKEWRLSILERDGHKCQECSGGDKLHIHHLVPSKVRIDLFYDPDNVIVLCQECHFKEHRSVGHLHKGRSCKKYLVITTKVLSKASGRCEETVRRHIREGKVDPWRLSSIRDWLNKVGRLEEEKNETQEI